MKKCLLILLLVVLWVCGKSQPASPFLRIEEGMHTGTATGIAADTAGNLLLTCSLDKTARLWDAKNGHLLNIFRVPIADDDEGKLYTCTLSPDGHIAAVGGQTGTEWDETFCVYLFNTQTGEITHRITGLPGGALDLKFSKDGKWLGAGLSAGGVNIYNTANWSLARSLTGYADGVHSIAFDKNGDLATACYDGKIRLYDKRFGEITEISDLAGTHPGCVVFNPTDSLIAVAYDNAAEVEVRSARTLKFLYKPLIKIPYNGSYSPLKITFSADGSKMFAGGSIGKRDKKGNWEYTVREWNNKPNGTYNDFYVAQDNILGIEPLPNGNLGILGAHPEIYVMSATGEILWGYSSPKNMYNYEQRDKSEIKIDTGGFKIGFAPYGQNPLVFNVMSRQLLQGRPDYSEPLRLAAGTTVSISKERKPIINSREAQLDSGETVNGVDVSGNGKLVVVSSTFKLYAFNPEGALIWKTPLLSSAFSVNVSGNNKTVVAELGDGTIRWYSADDGQELVAFYSTSTQNASNQRLWILFTPSGYYDASAGAEDILGWHINNGPDSAPSFYSASSFRDQYYRPDIIDAIFKTYDEKKAIEFANSKASRPVKAAFDIKQSLPPQIFIKSPTYNDTVTKENITIKYAVQTPANAPVTALKVLIDGRPSPWENGQRGATLETTGDYDLSIQVPPSDCAISLLAENAYGSSRAATVYLKYKAPAVAANRVEIKPTLYILAVGINNYRSGQLNKLKYAVADARAFAESMRKFKGTTYRDVVVKLLVDSAATRDAIEDGFDWIQKNTSSQDVAMIFFAGHGITDPSSTFYMLPYAADINGLRKTGVNSADLRQTVGGIFGKVIVFIDACNSGKALGAAGLSDISDMNLVVNQLTGGQNGAFAFTSCRSKEVAYEDDKWQHGAFTKALLEGIEGQCCSTGKAGITPLGLADYVTNRVSVLTDDKQHSTFNSPPNSLNFNIGKM